MGRSTRLSFPFTAAGFVLLVGLACSSSVAMRDGPGHAESENTATADGGAAQTPGSGLAAGDSARGPRSPLEAAATALAGRRYDEALARLGALEAPPPDSERWFTLGALRGRALRLLGRHEEAVEALAPRWSGALSARFPEDALGLELARARLAWARSGALGLEQAEAQRKLAVETLGRVLTLRPLRNRPEVRVERARAMVELRGESEEEVRAVAGKAATALEEVLREFPAYPHRGALQLEHAHALERAGHSERSSRELRQIALTRAGEPEADAAWSALSVHAEQRKPVNAGPFSAREDLERAVHARRLHHAELSRALLDRVLDDARTTKDVRDEALRARADTAYAQQDYAQCAADLRETKRPALRRSLLRCLERGGLYREAIALSMGASGNSAPTGNATAVWETMELALRGGLYAVAEKLLADYEKLAKGHAAQRAWLHAWLPYRLGQWEEAVTAFERAERHPSQRIRARYFRGALLLARGGDDGRAQGASLLRGIADATPYEYYGLQARQRLLDAGADVAPCPTLEPLPDEAAPPPHEAIVERFEALDAKFGDTWAPLRRARQLHAAGYVDEARRELRIAVEAFLSRGKASRGPRSESLFQGLGWKDRWPSPPRLDLPDTAFAVLRDEGARDALRSGLRLLARGLDEPFDFARLTTTPAGSPHARWHLRAYRDVIEREARLRSIDPVDLWSLMHTESHFHRHVVSPVGARGALQIMPSTARRLAERLGELDGGRFDDDSLFDIDQNGHLAAYYVAELSKKFHGQAPMAYASYNGGPHNVARWLTAKSTSEAPLTLDAFVEEIPFSETYRYTRRVMEVSARYAMLYRGELPRWTNAVDPRVEDNIDF